MPVKKKELEDQPTIPVALTDNEYIDAIIEGRPLPPDRTVSTMFGVKTQSEIRNTPSLIREGNPSSADQTK